VDEMLAKEFKTMIFFKKINIFQENTENITNRIILYRI
jgi:hypothetical protein